MTQRHPFMRLWLASARGTAARVLRGLLAGAALLASQQALAVALTCSIGFSTPQNTTPTHTLTGAENTACDPNSLGIANNTLGDDYVSNPIATTTTQGGQLRVYGAQYGLNQLIYSPPSASFVGTDTAQFYVTVNGINWTLGGTVTITVTGSTPTVTAVSPTSGSTAGGTSVTLTGTNFSGSPTVSFGGTSGTGVTVNSSTSISVTAPAHAAGTIDITVTTTGGTSSTSAADRFTYVAPAVANSVSATVAHGSSSNNISLSITGGAATSVAVSTAASHGTATASGTTISYTPSASYSGTDTFAYTATNAAGTSSPATATITVSAPTVSYAPTSPTGGSVGTAYSQSLTSASGGTSPYSYTVNSGSLPAGLSLASNGTLSGTPTAGGSFNFTVTATDSSTGTGPFTATSGVLTLVVAAPTITVAPASLTAATVGSAYSSTVTASGGTSAYTYAVTAGALPAGLSLSSSGTLSGTPTSGGTFNFTVTATDSSTGAGPYTGSRAYSLTVNGPTISVTPASLGAAAIGSAYSTNVTASGGTSTYTYAITSGSLPAGLSLSSGGTLSGTPTASGAFNFTVTATDSSTGAGPYTGSRAYSLTVSGPTISVGPASLSTATIGSGYSGTITASGGTSAYTYAITAGSLPAGLSLSSGGTLSGMPTSGGTFNFTVTATDSSTGTGPFTGSRAYVMSVTAPTISVTPASLSAAMIGSAYSTNITASGGTSTYTYAVTSGSLPAGLSLSSVGALTGTPTAAGSFSFTVTATDSSTGSGPYTGSSAYTFAVNGPTLTLSPASGSSFNGTVSTAYSQTFAAGAGVSPYTYALNVTSGTLPTGLSFNTATGVLSGTPTSAGTVNFTVTAHDSSTGTGAPFSVSGTYSLTTPASIITLAPSILPAPAIGTVYSQTVSGGGGLSPYTYAVTAGALPAGLTLNTSTGGISGTPTGGGAYSFTIKTTDANGFNTTRTYSGSVASATVVVAPANFPVGQVAVAYSQTASASGGTAPYTFSISAGALPTGITLNTATGVISGTPTVANTFNFTVKATDSSTGTGAPYFGTQAYSLVINPVAPIAGAKSATVAYNTATPIDLSTAIAGAPAASVAVAGAPTHGSTSVSGTTVTYTPSAGYSGVDSFTYTATNAGGTSGTATVSITVTPQTPTVSAVSATVAYNSSSNTITLSLGGGAATSVAVATAATHGTATASGTSISYTPSPGYIGTDSFTYTATNAGGTSSPATVNLTVNPSVPVAGPVATTVAFNSGSNVVALALTGGAAVSVAVPTAPTHGNVTITGTSISYTPTVGYSGTDSFTYTATNAGGTSAPATVSLTVNPSMPVVGPVAATVAFNSSGNAITLSLGGGAATSVAVAAVASHGTATASGTSISYTPSAGYIGADSFTYTATNAAGTSAAATVSITVNPSAPVAGPVAAAVAFNSSSNVVALALTGGAAVSVAVPTAPTHGNVTITGTSISYTPTANYSGTDSFTYTATNAGGTSAAATVSVTVSTPTLTLLPNLPNLPNGQVGAAYSQALSASGGTAPYRYSVSAGALPAGLSLNAGTGAIAGTPTTAGAFNFTIKVTDSTSGTAASGTQAYAVTVNPALPVAVGASVTVQPNTPLQIDLSNMLSGGPAVTLVVTVQPSHGTAVLNGTTVTYTPVAGYAGPDSFSYAAGNASGTSQPAAVAITVLPPAPVAQPVTVTVINGSPAGGGGSNATVIPLTIAGGPATSVNIITPPQHGTLNITGLQASSSARAKALAAGRADVTPAAPSVTYTPNTGYYGTDSFSYTASNVAGTSVAATVSITIIAPPPTLGTVSATTKSGQPVTLAVTANAVGGPFTALTLVTPPSHGQAVVQGMAIIYTSQATFAGTDTLVYALSNASGSTQGTATVTVAGRLDPSKDVQVSGLLSAQADATRRFASSQLDNFSRRLESLHGDGWAKPSFGLSLSSFGVDSALPTDPIAQLNASAAKMGGENGMLPGVGPAAWRGLGANLAQNESQNPAPKAASRATPESARNELSWWVGGSIDFGHRDQLTGESRFRFHTDGVSMGADYRVSQLWSVGVGGGFSSDRSDVGTKGSKSTSDSSVLAVYAALRPAQNTFVDAVLGHSSLSFDLNRFITDEGGFATGHRRGSQWFGSLASGYEYRERQGQLLSAYARLDLMRAKLNGYAESASDLNSLSYGDQTVRMTTGRLGLRGETVYMLSGSELQPRARIEYQHHFEGADQATMSYTDLGSAAPVYIVQPLGARRSQWMAEVGGKWVLRSGFAVSLDYGSSLATGGGAIHTVRMGAEGKF
ncbi:putative Ig domain-containing protein [Roseateles sp. BYS78W]|uniref:Ig domain-containing protein n=1 Tax=Pelomonas candidula TaxID=3299025 RepID=A0ABW7HI84_9BURK